MNALSFWKVFPQKLIIRYSQFQLVIELGMKSAKNKPLTKKERKEKKKKRKEKQAK